MSQPCTATPIGRVLEKVALNVKEQVSTLFRHGTKKVIILAGPTGAGKTMLSLHLAQILGGEVISADSMQVYRGMDIGTAKATPEERALVPHHLVDIRDIDEPFNVKDFCEEAMAACQDILSRGKVPIFVGGTGFYIHAFLYGPPKGPACDPRIRAQLAEEEERFGVELLYEKLVEIDPIYAATVSRADKHKILRALEIIEISGKKVSDFLRSKEPIAFFDLRCWYVHWPREILYKRLEKRCDEMLAQGLLDEVVELDRHNIRQNRTASQAIGYRQTLEFLDTGRTAQDYEEYVKNLKQASRHLAKRQFTWFRKEPCFRWLDLSQHTADEVLEIIAHDYEQDTPSVVE